MNKILTAFALSGVCLAMTGCASIFGSNSPADRTLMVNSNPAGAQVLLNNQPIGVTPVQVQVANPTQDNTVTLQRKGYNATTVPVATTFQGVGWVNILFWPGFIVDYMTGDMKKLSDSSMTVTLSPVNSSMPVVVTAVPVSGKAAAKPAPAAPAAQPVTAPATQAGS